MSMSCLDCHDYMNGYNQGKKEGTIEELEQIKSQLTSIKSNYFEEFAKFDRAKGIEEVISIIDNEIKRLKE